MSVPPVFVDVCTAVGLLVVVANVVLLTWVALRASCMWVADWLDERRSISAGCSLVGEVPAQPADHPSIGSVPGGGRAGTARSNTHRLRAVPPPPTSKGGAA